MLVQSSKAENYTMQTMLVALPQFTNNGVNYKITVKPKVAVVNASNGRAEDIINLNSLIKKLPQTGVLNLPILILAVAGFMLFCTSLVLFYFKKYKTNIILTVFAFVMVLTALILQINNEMDNYKLNKESLEVTNQIEQICNNYVVNNEAERIKKLDIDGTNYIGILSIPSLNNMSLRGNR